ncbi:lytic polysaccharide monooxygenase [Sphaerobolus stellatus SS14]|uniref:AA9 family lytic polysaccharide monooxygenase n=1 Tax=Sphaerobolus stellatus (strain SS14) TaxID=990650 RepID=A0A0C9VVA9_SPHS4|nr:lytic polysaccharide monooxygenase [Sphaerobolus stellatus SS14]
MQLLSLLSILAFISFTAAHCTVWGLWANGVDQGDGRNLYIRSPPNNNPVKNITSKDIACNVNNRLVPNKVPVEAGDTLTIEWYHDTRDDDIIASSHHGLISVWIAPLSSNGEGPVWTKIFEDTYDGSLWAIDRLIPAHGQHSVLIPDIPAGDYLVRPELIALHEANALYSQNPIRGAPFYISCIQITVTSDGTQPLPDGISFPGEYTDSSPGIQWNLYKGGPDPNTYVAPGPAVWDYALGCTDCSGRTLRNP